MEEGLPIRRGFFNPRRYEPNKKYLKLKEQKFSVPPSELDNEQFIKTITPHSAEKQGYINAFLNDYIEKAKKQGGEEAMGKIIAAEVWKLNLAMKDADQKSDTMFAVDFYNWLRGQGTPDDIRMTGWGNARIRDEECLDYIEMFLEAKLEFQNFLFKLSKAYDVLGPLNGIFEHYLYFKYIVRNSPDLNSIDFLKDYNLLEQTKTLRQQRLVPAPIVIPKPTPAPVYETVPNFVDVNQQRIQTFTQAIEPIVQKQDVVGEQVVDPVEMHVEKPNPQAEILRQKEAELLEKERQINEQARIYQQGLTQQQSSLTAEKTEAENQMNLALQQFDAEKQKFESEKKEAERVVNQALDKIKADEKKYSEEESRLSAQIDLITNQYHIAMKQKDTEKANELKNQQDSLQEKMTQINYQKIVAEEKIKELVTDRDNIINERNEVFTRMAKERENIVSEATRQLAEKEQEKMEIQRKGEEALAKEKLEKEQAVLAEQQKRIATEQILATKEQSEKLALEAKQAAEKEKSIAQQGYDKAKEELENFKRAAGDLANQKAKLNEDYEKANEIWQNALQEIEDKQRDNEEKEKALLQKGDATEAQLKEIEETKKQLAADQLDIDKKQRDFESATKKEIERLERKRQQDERQLELQFQQKEENLRASLIAERDQYAAQLKEKFDQLELERAQFESTKTQKIEELAQIQKEQEGEEDELLKFEEELNEREWKLNEQRNFIISEGNRLNELVRQVNEAKEAEERRLAEQQENFEKERGRERQRLAEEQHETAKGQHSAMLQLQAKENQILNEEQQLERMKEDIERKKKELEEYQKGVVTNIVKSADVQKALGNLVAKKGPVISGRTTTSTGKKSALSMQRNRISPVRIPGIVTGTTKEKAKREKTKIKQKPTSEAQQRVAEAFMDIST